jgi:rubrerythrin
LKDTRIEGRTLSEWTLERALKLALNMEEESIKLYTSAQNRVVNPGSMEFLKELVKEEEKHKNRILEAMKDQEKVKEIGSYETKIQDLKIVDYLEDVSLSPEAGYQEILIYAGKREKATHDFYMELARTYNDEEIGRMFAKLAHEELKHKYRLEQEYDDVILKHM